MWKSENNCSSSLPFVLRGVKYFFGSKLSKRSFRLSLKKALFCKQRKRYHSINTVLAPGSGTYTRVELSLPSGTRVLASQRDERFGAKPGLVWRACSVEQNRGWFTLKSADSLISSRRPSRHQRPRSFCSAKVLWTWLEVAIVVTDQKERGISEGKKASPGNKVVLCYMAI